MYILLLFCLVNTDPVMLICCYSAWSIPIPACWSFCYSAWPIPILSCWSAVILPGQYRSRHVNPSVIRPGQYRSCHTDLLLFCLVNTDLGMQVNADNNMLILLRFCLGNTDPGILILFLFCLDDTDLGMLILPVFCRCNSDLGMQILLSGQYWHCMIILPPWGDVLVTLSRTSLLSLFLWRRGPCETRTRLLLSSDLSTLWTDSDATLLAQRLPLSLHTPAW